MKNQTDRKIINSFKSNILKVIEHPNCISINKELAIAKYDLIIAYELNNHNKFRTFIDVGSASGEYSYTFNKMFPNKLIYSFEPIPELHKQLKGHKPIKFALWNKNADIVFNIGDEARESSAVYKKRGGKIKKIQAKRFDNLKLAILKPALLKIDVEGAEKQVLEGFGDKLKEFDIVIIELNMSKEQRASEVIKLMENNGFYRFVQKDLRKDLSQCNMFFIRE